MKLSKKSPSWFLLNIIIFIVSSSISFVSVGQVLIKNISAQKEFANPGFPSNALILLADGSEKHIKDIQAGDAIASYEPVAGGYITTLVTKLQTNETEKTPITSVMLILEDFAVSLQANGGLAGVTLQAASDQPVLTANGKKELGKVAEGEILFCYDETSGQFHAFSVYAVQHNAFEIDKTYSLVTENKCYLVNNTVVLEQ